MMHSRENLVCGKVAYNTYTNTRVRARKRKKTKSHLFVVFFFSFVYLYRFTGFNADFLGPHFVRKKNYERLYPVYNNFTFNSFTKVFLAGEHLLFANYPFQIATK